MHHDQHLLNISDHTRMNTFSETCNKTLLRDLSIDTRFK